MHSCGRIPRSSMSPSTIETTRTCWCAWRPCTKTCWRGCSRIRGVAWLHAGCWRRGTETMMRACRVHGIGLLLVALLGCKSDVTTNVEPARNGRQAVRGDAFVVEGGSVRLTVVGVLGLVC